ncbi:MAG: hemerythrin domain-containing protein [Fibrobacteres bacterium]|nr:hemerythrin domain-containing protein [Fibrobacterota bacterium]
MNALLDKNIKEIIKEYNGVEDVLTKWNIGCTGCSMGTCRLRDIIEIHNLNESDEYSLFSEMAEVIYPGVKVEIPKLQRKPKVLRKKISPPLAALIEEHVNIKRVIAKVQLLITADDKTLLESTAVIEQALDFIRNYADKFHHAKEEDILFKFFDANSDIIVAMEEEHVAGRKYVRSVADALKTGNTAAIRNGLKSYTDLLTEHIKKEDEILYPWMDRQLSDRDIGQLFSKFAEVDEKFSSQNVKYVSLFSEG